MRVVQHCQIRAVHDGAAVVEDSKCKLHLFVMHEEKLGEEAGRHNRVATKCVTCSAEVTRGERAACILIDWERVPPARRVLRLTVGAQDSKRQGTRLG